MIILIIPTVKVYSAGDTIIKLDGKLLKTGNKNSYISKNGRTMIPVREISNSLGYTVKWLPDKGNGQIQISNDELLILLEIGDNIASVNGLKTPIDIQDGVIADTKVELKNGTTYVPLRFIMETFNATVEYSIHKGTSIINIKSPSKDKPKVEFITPQLQVIQQTKVPDGTFFVVRLKNFKDYKGKNAKFTAYLEDHKHYDHYKYRNPVRPEETIIVDVTERYKDRSVGKEDKWFDLYRFEKTKNHLDLKTGKIQALPKIGEKIKIRVELEMNGVKKSYFTEVPFKGGASSYKVK